MSICRLPQPIQAPTMHQHSTGDLAGRWVPSLMQLNISTKLKI